MSGSKNYSVLLVDDEITVLENMYEYFSVLFTTVYKASNGKEALEIYNLKHPDMIFTDVEMPLMNGFSFISKIKEQDKKTPIVVISAYDDKYKLHEAIKLHIVDYIVKPITSAKLKFAINMSIKEIENLNTMIELKNGYYWDPQNLFFYKDGKVIELTESETKLLTLLINNLGTAIESVDIFNYVWHNFEREYTSKSIRSLISRFRKKLSDTALIKNIYGSKYMLCVDNF